MASFEVADHPIPGATSTEAQSVDCETITRMSLPALLYHALVELAQPRDPYGLPV